jgi:polyferredoxin
MAAVAETIPDFSDYLQPELAPEPLARWTGDAIDAGVLAVLLAWWVLGRRTRPAWRWLPLGAALLWLGFIRQGCLCPVGSLGAVLAATLRPEVVLPTAAVVLLVLPLLTALLWGRAFCGGVCPLGAVQEVAGVYSRRLPAWISRWLPLGPWLVLAVTAGVAVLGDRLPCVLDPWVTLFRRSGSTGAWIALGLWLLAAAVVWRPFCRLLCPLGALLGLASRLAWRPRRIDPDRCRDCGACAPSCPMHAISAHHIDPAACLDCGRCQPACRSGAIR